MKHIRKNQKSIENSYQPMDFKILSKKTVNQK